MDRFYGKATPWPVNARVVWIGCALRVMIEALQGGTPEGLDYLRRVNVEEIET